ncbi:hypothetical protein N5923_07470 [Erwiniaceae bacterium BAC15a-03b]|uniref:Uncharacterized protein n=1 Tax=Winslowiella arboricola TaxID=2978220 RepID=A0A9J6PTF5_9GAMM|nr:hypothetical protein [Winslowiella arboricola]MCU5773946.1 hypothetical protein [Winslowiella arboricola]MCU5777327.1 hypothetical protein [Winslowiella arboricola]
MKKMHLLMKNYPEGKACKNCKKPLPVAEPIVCVKSWLCRYPSPGKTV